MKEIITNLLEDIKEGKNVEVLLEEYTEAKKSFTKEEVNTMLEQAMESYDIKTAAKLMTELMIIKQKLNK